MADDSRDDRPWDSLNGDPRASSLFEEERLLSARTAWRPPGITTATRGGSTRPEAVPRGSSPAPPC